MVASYLLYRAGQFIALTLPLPWSYWIAERFADLQYSRNLSDRRAVTSNLRAVTGDPAIAQRLTREVFRNFGKYIVDFVRSPHVDAAFIAQHVRVEGLEHAQDTLARYGGAISVTAHLGNWEWAGAVTAQLGLPVAAVALNHRDARINDFFNAQRRAKGITTIPPGLALRHCHRLLQQRHVVALLGDRNYTSRGVTCQLFGRSVELPHAARMSGSWPSIMLFSGYMLWATLECLKPMWVVVACAAVISAWALLYQYFVVYPTESKYMFDAWIKDDADKLKTQEDWQQFLLHYHRQNYHCRYFLVQKMHLTCRQANELWWQMYHALKEKGLF